MGSLNHASILPPGSWDTHVHIFDPSIGPYAPSRAYTPANATFPELMQFGSSLTQTGQPPNFVVVQPSPYGKDNHVMLKTLQSFKTLSQCNRGIAVFDIYTVTDTELQEMHDLGVRGLRLNLQADGQAVNTTALTAQLTRAADRIAHLPGWMLQVYVPGYIWTDLFDAFANLPVPVIADHIGGLLGPSKLPAGSDSDPINQAGYQSLLELAERQKVIVKVSGFYRASTKNETAYDDLEPIISSLAARVPDQLIWASDWPHTGDGADRDPQNHEKIEQFRKVDDAGVLKQLRQWFTCEAWRKMMVANPSRIYNAGGTVCN